MIPVDTPKGRFRVWTKRIGNNPRIKLLLLHGGPGTTHEYLEPFDNWLPAAGVEYYYYDQLGSTTVTNPTTPTCGRSTASWTRWSRSAPPSA
jgi:proline iminopeptidase